MEDGGGSLRGDRTVKGLHSEPLTVGIGQGTLGGPGPGPGRGRATPASAGAAGAAGKLESWKAAGPLCNGMDGKPMLAVIICSENQS